MRLEYRCTVSGELKTVGLAEYEQDKTARWFTAECVTANGWLMEINRYHHLWRNDKCLGTEARLLPEYHDDEYPVWREVQVHWCHARRWVVRALPTRNDWGDYLDDFATQKEAIDEALIYAFDTSCGPERAERVVIYTKNDDIKKIITEAAQ